MTAQNDVMSYDKGDAFCLGDTKYESHLPAASCDCDCAPAQAGTLQLVCPTG